jgi:pseudouridylate synthase
VNSLLSIRDDVAVALAAGDPVVALESTVIAHGLPRPRNLETARNMESAVRNAGAIPATIAVLDGKIVIGLSDEQLAHLATRDDVAKVSPADISAVLAAGLPGATTVAGTMFAASRAGISVLATGGIGGVHRGGESSLDISADLAELARTKVAIVCAGAKAVLDLPRTLEVLETLSVPVVGFGTAEFPAFYSRESGLPLLHRVDTPEQAAHLMHVQWELGRLGHGVSAGILFAQPPPAASALQRTEMEALVTQAVESVEASGVQGKGVTPFLLQDMARRSGGRTLQANIALLMANADLAARIAIAYSATRSAFLP